MLRATATSHDGDAVDSITLDHEQRHRRRAALVSDGGWWYMIASSMEAVVSPLKGTTPVRSSYINTPRLKRSLR